MVVVLFDRRQRDEPVAVERRKRGRKRKEGTLIVSVRMEKAVYDEYCRLAIRADVPVRSILRRAVRVFVRKDETQ